MYFQLGIATSVQTENQRHRENARINRAFRRATTTHLDPICYRKDHAATRHCRICV